MAAGYQLYIADGVVSASGTPVAIYAVNIVSNGAAIGKVILRNGTSASDTAVISINGSTGIGTLHDFGGAGLVFPSGCFVDIDANTAQATVAFKRFQ